MHVSREQSEGEPKERENLELTETHCSHALVAALLPARVGQFGECT